MNPLPAFSDFFKALWGDDKEPFPWQMMLAEKVSHGRWPDAIDLPTAAGKTACIDIAVYGLAAQAEKPLAEGTAARRIWFVVDRRIVVDEAFERAQKLAAKLSDKLAPSPVRSVSERLLTIRGLPSRQRPLAVGRLRGGVLRDDGWARIPSQAAVITSTVDQLGSRLLFRSYGDSPLAAPIYAGLAGNDSLILLDEAHCAIPFLQTLRAIQVFRAGRWSEIENLTPFHATVLSATPPTEANEEALDVFPSEAARERALSDDRLQLRLRASKNGVLRKVRDEESLTAEFVSAAADFVRRGNRRIGIIVNRVARAIEIASMLRSKAERESLNSEPSFHVEVLTGRIRPFERDLLVGNATPLHRVLRSFEPEEPDKPLVIISTQCLEVGADFSFDALATECASLDALRQRFGRLDRLGRQGQSSALILIADSQLKEDESDPIYGEAIRNTWEFLKTIARIENAGTKHETHTVDFGVAAIAPLLPLSDDLGRLLAPSPNAPVLLPAHLDLFSQTAPLSYPAPDPDPFLHGKGRGLSEVKVVWRCDLAGLPSKKWLEVISLCRPVAGEMLPVPLHRFRQWLRKRESFDSTGDVEGVAEETNEERLRGSEIPEFVIWRGRERSELSNDPDKIPPGGVILMQAPLPHDAATLGQILQKQGLGRDRIDVWEPAWLETKRPPILRISRACLMQWLEVCPPLAELIEFVESGDWTIEELRDAFAAILRWTSENDRQESVPDWLRKLFNAIEGFTLRDIDEHPGGGLVIRAPEKSRYEEETDFFSDEDDDGTEAPNFVLFETHTEDVKRVASQLAGICLGGSANKLFEIAAQWHDVGKLDDRFQSMLSGGLPVVTGPLAKSPNARRTRDKARALREAVNLPQNFRHEMLSLQVAERFPPVGVSPEDHALVLHLIASHHGYARPFAPICEDRKQTSFETVLGDLRVNLSAAERSALMPAHRLESGVSDRFWRLTRRFGWWGLAYREAILRLADWYASANPK